MPMNTKQHHFESRIMFPKWCNRIVSTPDSMWLRHYNL